MQDLMGHLCLPSKATEGSCALASKLELTKMPPKTKTNKAWTCAAVAPKPRC